MTSSQRDWFIVAYGLGGFSSQLIDWPLWFRLVCGEEGTVVGAYTLFTVEKQKREIPVPTNPLPGHVSSDLMASH